MVDNYEREMMDESASDVICIEGMVKMSKSLTKKYVRFMLKYFDKDSVIGKLLKND